MNTSKYDGSVTKLVDRENSWDPMEASMSAHGTTRKNGSTASFLAIYEYIKTNS